MRAKIAEALRVFTKGHENVLSLIGSRPAAASQPVCEMLESRQLLSTTYYVSPSGSDSASGKSSSTPWKTITRVNSQAIHAGDTILFKGGSTFSGSLYFSSTEGGTSTSLVTLGIYGSGRATINSGSKRGLDIAQTAGFSISNLNFVGNGMNSNSSEGIDLHIDFSNKNVSTFKINNVNVSGYGHEGIRLMVDGSNSSVSNVSITNTVTHDNLWNGIKITGDKNYSLNNYTIDHVTAYNNYGSKSVGDVTGSGIYMADVNGGMINRCMAYNNGKDGAAPVGIWASGSNRVTIQFCESYNNHTNAISDGGGFDFDWDETNSIMQYNYSHNNDGPGFLLYAGTHKSDGNIIRYNISENDGRKNQKAGIDIGGNVTNALVENNVVYIASTGGSTQAAFQAHDWGSNGLVPKNITVINNIFDTTGGTPLIYLTSGVATKGSFKFNGNDYYSGSSSFKIDWGSNTYGSLSSWQSAKGQEKLNGVATGYQGDPKLTSAGHGGTITNIDSMTHGLTAYTLQSSSPLINKGVAQPGVLSSVTRDLFGDVPLKGGKYDIGVDEKA